MKKKKYEENRGLTGRGTDYGAYRMSGIQSLASFAAGAAAGTAAFTVFFGFSVIAAAAAAAGGAAGLRYGKKFFMNRRNRELTWQFRDFLESSASSLSAGKNISGAVESAYTDIVQLYGEKSCMAAEIAAVRDGMRNNITAEELFSDFAERSGQRDIKTFADTFCVCNRTGGNMREVMIKTTGILSEKMQTEREIDVIASRGKNELMLMTAMPFIILPMLRTLGEEYITGGNAVTLAVRAAGAVLIAAAVIAGRKITDIRI